MNSLRNFFYLPLFFVLLTLSACSDVFDVSYDFDETYPISQVQTFGWLPLAKRNPSRMDEVTYQRIVSSVETELAGKGLRNSGDQPSDVLIEVTFGSQGGHRRTGRGSRYNFREGYLYINLVDPETDKLVWGGSGRAVLSYEVTPESAQKTIDEVVNKILRNFPPK